MNDKRKVGIIAGISFLVISLLGTLFHFAYEFFSKNLVLGAIFAVNESVWEHLKLLVIPMFICSIYEYSILKENRDNFFLALLLKIIIAMLFVIGVFYSYTSIIGNHIAVVNIITFVLAVFIAQVVWYNTIIKIKISNNGNKIAFIALVIILLSFILFTYIPLKFDLFRDNSNNTYGIFELGGIFNVKTNLETRNFSLSSTCSTCNL